MSSTQDAPPPGHAPQRRPLGRWLFSSCLVNLIFLGLLGSDILSRFKVITVDYKDQRLVFNPGPSGKLAALR